MKMILLIIFLSLCFPAFCPEFRTLPVEQSKGIRPYEKIWKAICKIESDNNPLAYHLEDNGCASIGIVQIQWSRLDDFNRRTGKNYSHSDMYNIEKSKDVFMYYAAKIDYWDAERISRLWNAGPNGMRYKQTKTYWELVKIQIEKI